MIEKLKQLIRLGMITNHGNDSGIIPRQQITYHGKKGNSTAWHDYGFHSLPINNSVVLILAPNGNSEERVHIASSMGDRPKGNPGEVFVFHPSTGAQIKMSADGSIEITSAKEVNITVPETNITGNLNVTGIITADGEITSGTVTLAGHTHSQGIDGNNDAQVDTGTGTG